MTCPYCSITTSGEHEFDCIMNKDGVPRRNKHLVGHGEYADRSRNQCVFSVENG